MHPTTKHKSFPKVMSYDQLYCLFTCGHEKLCKKVLHWTVLYGMMSEYKYGLYEEQDTEAGNKSKKLSEIHLNCKQIFAF